MAEGRRRDEWSRMSTLLAMLVNCHRDPKKSSQARPRDFDPFAKPVKPLKVGIGVLKQVFINQKIPREV